MMSRAQRGIVFDVREPECAEVNLEAFDAVWHHVKRHTSRFWSIKKKQQRRDKNKMESNKYTPEQRRAAEMLLKERRGGGHEPSENLLASTIARPTVKKQQERKPDAEPRKPLSREPSFLELLKDDAEDAIAAFYEIPTPKQGYHPSMKASRLTFAKPAAATADSTHSPAAPEPSAAAETAEHNASAEMASYEPRSTVQHATDPSSILKRSTIAVEDLKDQAMTQIRRSVAKSCGGKKACKGGDVPENVVLRSRHHKTDAFSNLADVRLVGLLHEPHAWQPDVGHEVAEAQRTAALSSHKEAHDTPAPPGPLLEPPLSSFLNDAHAPKEPVVEHIPRHFKSDLLWLHPPRSVPASKVVVEDRHELDQKVVFEVPPVEYADEATAALIARQRRRQGRDEKSEPDKGRKGPAGRFHTSRLAQTRRPPSKEKTEEAPEPTMCDQPEVPAFEWSKSRANPTTAMNTRMPRLSAKQSQLMRMRQAEKAEKVEKEGAGNGSVPMSRSAPQTPNSRQTMLPIGRRGDRPSSTSSTGTGFPYFFAAEPGDSANMTAQMSTSRATMLSPPDIQGASSKMPRRTELTFTAAPGSPMSAISPMHMAQGSNPMPGLFLAEMTDSLTQSLVQPDKPAVPVATPSSERSTIPSRGPTLPHQSPLPSGISSASPPPVDETTPLGRETVGPGGSLKAEITPIGRGTVGPGGSPNAESTQTGKATPSGSPKAETNPPGGSLKAGTPPLPKAESTPSGKASPSGVDSTPPSAGVPMSRPTLGMQQHDPAPRSPTPPSPGVPKSDPAPPPGRETTAMEPTVPTSNEEQAEDGTQLLDELLPELGF
eukprot:gnl/MRDRNA2_/MRDRNA2_59397_c0_seq1.p1 gnl/MRDRNA2_/MRDRNA2_59397_c0~~gnl/MRDRNA2_/MRDRNA2_59397_c0_seq1.p1  ORF type:complete len:826 (+),score=174.37 gnl/MRDRNA2_/MRDRNA2_59397_c0_seq1:120-2597(+)